MAHHFRSAAAIADEVNAGALDPVDVVNEFVERIETRNEITNAYLHVLDEDARIRARDVRQRVEAGETLPLAGVPVAMKDLSDTKAGVPHTMGMKPLAGHVADETSVSVRRLEDAGAVVVGTTNTPEMGHRVRTDNMLAGPTATPFDPDRNAGGSSGGSAAALADGLCALATGSDVGGSLRVPASCCGVVSVKPTRGLVPHGTSVNGYLGLKPFAVTGPMARDVDSLARMLDVMAGRDRVDPFSTPPPANYTDAVASAPAVDELTLAYSPTLDLFPVSSAVRDAVDETLSELEDAGASVEEVSLDVPERSAINHANKVSVTTFFAMSIEEVNRLLGYDVLDRHADDVPDLLETLVHVGETHELTDYTHADFPRTELYHAVEDALSGYDALVCPTLATLPLTHDEPLPTEIDGQPTDGLPTDHTLAWIFNLTGHPVVNVPASLADGVPVGMQLVGSTFSEANLLGVAAAIERTCPWTYPDE